MHNVAFSVDSSDCSSKCNEGSEKARREGHAVLTSVLVGCVDGGLYACKERWVDRCKRAANSSLEGESTDLVETSERWGFDIRRGEAYKETASDETKVEAPIS